MFIGGAPLEEPEDEPLLLEELPDELELLLDELLDELLDDAPPLEVPELLEPPELLDVELPEDELLLELPEDELDEELLELTESSPETVTVCSTGGSLPPQAERQSARTMMAYFKTFLLG